MSSLVSYLKVVLWMIGIWRVLSRVAPYKVPKEFIFCDQLPRNNTGKILKNILRERSLNDLVNRKR